MPKIRLGSILETSIEWDCHQVRLTWSQSNVVGEVCVSAELCSWKCQRVVDSYRNGMTQPLSRDHSKTSKNRFYVNLFYLVGSNVILIDTAQLFYVFFSCNVTCTRIYSKKSPNNELSEHGVDSSVFAGGQKFVVILKLIILLWMAKLLSSGKITGDPLDNNETSTLYLYM